MGNPKGGSRPKDLCNRCDRFAKGCKPIALENGNLLRVPQRDFNKRYCHYHMPKERRDNPPIKIKRVTLPEIPKDVTLVTNDKHKFTPAISSENTVLEYFRRAYRVRFESQNVCNMRWVLQTPFEAFQQDDKFFIVCILQGMTFVTREGVRAVCYTPSRQADSQWLWRREGRDKIHEAWAKEQYHVNMLMWQWGIDMELMGRELLLHKE